MNKSLLLNGVWKSGNHLLMKLVEQLGVNYGNRSFATSSILGGDYFFRQVLRGAWMEKSPVNIGLEVPVNVRQKWVRSALVDNRNKAVMGHAAYSDCFLSILRSEGFKTIQIVRDPRDVVLSFARWIGDRPDYYAYSAFCQLTLEQKMRNVITGFSCGSLYFESIASVLDRSYGWLTASPEEILVVRFEDLVGSRGGGCDLAQMAAISKVCKFIYGEELPAIQQSVACNLFGGTKTFKDGQIGAWKNYFDADLRRVFDETVGPRMRLWGYQ